MLFSFGFSCSLSQKKKKTKKPQTSDMKYSCFQFQVTWLPLRDLSKWQKKKKGGSRGNLKIKTIKMGKKFRAMPQWTEWQMTEFGWIFACLPGSKDTIALFLVLFCFFYNKLIKVPVKFY